ncbi:MAG: hypothetical protein DDT22_01159 [candidate division WS2 bacterium]|nr:hypothetical protein [Bacillota bacterium]MBT9175480.1 hypothetical protein [Candidatus Lithacetigena glycinireducens]
MIDREINIDGEDVEKYIAEVEKTAKMEKEMRSAGKKVKGGYILKVVEHCRALRYENSREYEPAKEEEKEEVNNE